MSHNITGNGGVYDGIPFFPYSEKDRLVSWADAIITTPGKVRNYIPLKDVYFIQHNQNREIFNVSHGRVIYCANHVKSVCEYECIEDYVLWPFNRYMGAEPLPPCPNGKVTLVNCNANKGGRFLGELAKQLPEVQFLGVHSGYKPQISCDAPNIEYRTGSIDLREVFKDTSLFIMPSEKEGLPTIALEALSLGIPVLMNNIPAAHEMGVISAGYKQFATAIRAMLDKYNDMRTFSLNLAEIHAQKHTQQIGAFYWFC